MLAAVFYHDIFDYPLTARELIKWQAGEKINIDKKIIVDSKKGFYFLRDSRGLITKRLLRKRFSAQKMKKARKAGKILNFIPTIKMVGVTGALAMENAPQEADIDLLFITQKGFLWTSRLIVLLLLKLTRFPLRKFGDKQQKDKLCLNMWIDERDLVWPANDRNAYTAHEIAQIIPLINRDNAYEKLIWKNRWILDYWPSAVRIPKVNFRNQKSKSKSENPSNPVLKASFLPMASFLSKLIEPVAYRLQYLYMKKKITREVVTPTRAIFHPYDWGNIVRSRLTS